MIKEASDCGVKTRNLMVLAVVVFLLTACAVNTLVFPQTSDEWKKFFTTVPIEFVAMVLGTLAHGLIQTKNADSNGTPMTFLEYWSYVRELVIALIVNAAAFVGLLMADQLNISGAFTLGIAGNAAASLLTNGRTKDLVVAPEARG
jgi:hypothetical protein